MSRRQDVLGPPRWALSHYAHGQAGPRTGWTLSTPEFRGWTPEKHHVEFIRQLCGHDLDPLAPIEPSRAKVWVAAGSQGRGTSFVALLQGDKTQDPDETRQDTSRQDVAFVMGNTVSANIGWALAEQTKVSAFPSDGPSDTAGIRGLAAVLYKESSWALAHSLLAAWEKGGPVARLDLDAPGLSATEAMFVALLVGGLVGFEVTPVIICSDGGTRPPQMSARLGDAVTWIRSDAQAVPQGRSSLPPNLGSYFDALAGYADGGAIEACKVLLQHATPTLLLAAELDPRVAALEGKDAETLRGLFAQRKTGSSRVSGAGWHHPSPAQKLVVGDRRAMEDEATGLSMPDSPSTDPTGRDGSEAEHLPWHRRLRTWFALRGVPVVLVVMAAVQVATTYRLVLLTRQVEHLHNELYSDLPPEERDTAAGAAPVVAVQAAGTPAKAGSQQPHPVAAAGAGEPNLRKSNGQGTANTDKTAAARSAQGAAPLSAGAGGWTNSATDESPRSIEDRPKTQPNRVAGAAAAAGSDPTGHDPPAGRADANEACHGHGRELQRKWQDQRNPDGRPDTLKSCHNALVEAEGATALPKSCKSLKFRFNKLREQNGDNIGVAIKILRDQLEKDLLRLDEICNHGR